MKSRALDASLCLALVATAWASAPKCPDGHVLKWMAKAGKKAPSTTSAYANSGTSAGQCCLADCKHITCPDGQQKKSTLPSGLGQSITTCCEADSAKCAAATVTCPAGKMRGNPGADAGNDADAKKTNCCVDEMCSSATPVTCDNGKAWSYDSSVKAGADANAKKTNCCKDVAQCAAVTCAAGWKAKDGSPTCNAVSTTACLTQCCKTDSFKCAGTTRVTCPAGMVWGNPGATAGTTSSDKKNACCVFAGYSGTCGAWALGDKNPEKDAKCTAVGKVNKYAPGGAKTIPCPASGCTVGHCCDLDATTTCETYSCPTGKKKKSSVPKGHCGSRCTQCCEDDSTKCAAASVTCPAGKMRGNPGADAGDDDAKKKKNCCVDEMCSSATPVTCDNSKAWSYDSAVKAGADANAKKTNCCKDVAKCAAVTCAEGWQAKDGSPTCNAVSTTACLTQCCKTDSSKCAGITPLTCPAGKVWGNPGATAGTSDAEKKENCCKTTPAETDCTSFLTSNPGSASGADGHQMVGPAAAALAAIAVAVGLK